MLLLLLFLLLFFLWLLLLLLFLATLFLGLLLLFSYFTFILIAVIATEHCPAHIINSPREEGSDVSDVTVASGFTKMSIQFSGEVENGVCQSCQADLPEWFVPIYFPMWNQHILGLLSNCVFIVRIR
jgi:hypothetical protein